MKTAIPSLSQVSIHAWLQENHIVNELGVPIDFDDALAIEALLSAAAAVAFLVPVNAGVQEAGYAGLGLVFGVPPDVSLGVSLVRRGRDIVVGVPILLLWQFIEMRRLRGVAVEP